MKSNQAGCLIGATATAGMRCCAAGKRGWGKSSGNHPTSQVQSSIDGCSIPLCFLSPRMASSSLTLHVSDVRSNKLGTRSDVPVCPRPKCGLWRQDISGTSNGTRSEVPNIRPNPDISGIGVSFHFRIPSQICWCITILKACFEIELSF